MNGLQSIPRTHQGEQLSYISPQEAQLLRQQGGGVAPDGGQLLGPGGIPSFLTGPGPSAAGPTGGGTGGNAGANGSGNGGGFSGMRNLAPPAALVLPTPEPEPEPEFDVEAAIAERKALLDETYNRSKRRLDAIYASLGFATPAMYGEDTEGNPLFTGSPNISDQSGWAGYQGNQSPVGQIVNQALGAVPPTAQQQLAGIPSSLGQQQSLTDRISQQAQDLRAQSPQGAPVQQAAQGGVINRYDLGGLVNSMMLQASRTRNNIPSNAVS